MHSFSLKQFRTAGASSNFKITGSLGRHFNELSIDYELSGETKGLVFPSSSCLPFRRRGLWEQTCFEFFLSPKEADHYWEFNLSPAGHWNVYRFTSYRQGMKEEPAIVSLPFAVIATENIIQVSMKLNLDGIIPLPDTLKVGVSAVIRTLNEGTTYWALVLAGPRADFHSKATFIIEL
jgi:hypothetical protein